LESGVSRVEKIVSKERIAGIKEEKQAYILTRDTRGGDLHHRGVKPARRAKGKLRKKSIRTASTRVQPEKSALKGGRAL